MNLVHSDGCDPAQLAVLQAPLHKPFHRAIDRFPTGFEHPRCLAPTQPARPTRQESHHGAGHRALAVTPGVSSHIIREWKLAIREWTRKEMPRTPINKGVRYSRYRNTSFTNEASWSAGCDPRDCRHVALRLRRNRPNCA